MEYQLVENIHFPVASMQMIIVFARVKSPLELQCIKSFCASRNEHLQSGQILYNFNDWYFNLTCDTWTNFVRMMNHRSMVSTPYRIWEITFFVYRTFEAHRTWFLSLTKFKLASDTKYRLPMFDSSRDSAGNLFIQSQSPAVANNAD